MSPAITRITIGAGLVAGVAAVLVGDVAIDRQLDAAIAPGFWILLLATLLIGGMEFVRMLRVRAHPCQSATAVVFIVLMVAAVWLEIYSQPGAYTVYCIQCRDWTRALYWLSRLDWLHHDGLLPYGALIVGLLMASFVAEIIRVERSGSNIARAAQSIAWTLLVVMTVGLLGVFLAKIRFLSPDSTEGLMYLALFLGTVKASDIGAYAVGSTLGRHKLVPTLSPMKTWEGLAGALAGGTGAAVAIGCLWGRFAWPQMLVFGVAVSIASVLGDLGESLIKRACGVKDSGPIPGFGGILDILDSVLGAAPVAYLVLVLLTDALPS